MKKITLLFFLLTSALTIAQTIDNPPKKTWKILIKNSNNKEANFQLIGQTIIDNDFSIEKKDVEYLTMETTPKITEGQTSTFYLKFVAKDNLIILTGMGKSRVNVSLANTEEEYTKIKNMGMSGSVAKDQFKAMLNGNEFEFIVE
jgi:hypothetical protein